MCTYVPWQQLEAEAGIGSGLGADPGEASALCAGMRVGYGPAVGGFGGVGSRAGQPSQQGAREASKSGAWECVGVIDGANYKEREEHGPASRISG